MLTHTQERLLSYLLVLQDHGPIECAYGICFNVRQLGVNRTGGEFGDDDDEDLRFELGNVFTRLGLDTTYPVPGGPELYNEYSGSESNMWDADTEYGAARLELLQDMINHLKGL